MENAKDEFQDHIEGKKILCAKIYVDDISINLMVGHTEEDYEHFLDCLSSLKSGYVMATNSIIWYFDGSWSYKDDFHLRKGCYLWKRYSYPKIWDELKLKM